MIKEKDLKAFEYYAREYIKSGNNMTSLYVEPVRFDTGTFEHITIIDVDDKDGDGNPTVKQLSQPRNHVTSKKGSHLEKRTIILHSNGQKYMIVQATKITRR